MSTTQFPTLPQSSQTLFETFFPSENHSLLPPNPLLFWNPRPLAARFAAFPLHEPLPLATKRHWNGRHWPRFFNGLEKEINGDGAH